MRRYVVDWSKAPASPKDAVGLLYPPPLIEIRSHFEQLGFDVEVLLQSHSHKEPTAAKAIGFYWNWPTYPELQRWGNCVLRVHIGIYCVGDNPYAVPHLEPDALLAPREHMDMVRKKNDIRGQAAVEVLQTMVENLAVCL